MKIIIAIDSYKGCLTSKEANEAAQLGICDALGGDAEVHCFTVSDGGEGMLCAFTEAIGGSIAETMAHNAYGDTVKCQYGRSADGKTGIVEMAEASGLARLKQSPAPGDIRRASSYGTGELIQRCIDEGCTEIVVGLGGSATSDCGIGMLHALGLLACESEPWALTDNWRTKLPQQLRITIASDVTAPLCGSTGAAHVFAAQKGATPADIEWLDERAKRFAEYIKKATGSDLSTASGAGAAGGVGFALLALCQAKMESGAELLLQKNRLDSALENADWLITGEGSADFQTLMGKLPAVLQCHAQVKGVHTALLAGKVKDIEKLSRAGFDAVVCINDPTLPLEEALQPETAKRNIRLSAQNLARSFAVGAAFADNIDTLPKN